MKKKLPDEEEMEQTINKFLQQLEKQEKKGFKDLATLRLLSQLPKPAQGSARSMSVVEAKIRPICSPCQRFSCTDTSDMRRTKGY